MTKSRPPSAPDHLSDAAKSLWTSILKTWRLDDDASRAVLQTSLEAWDRCQRCRQQIDSKGETVEDRFGQAKPHPLLSAERDARSQFLTGLKQLGLEPPEANK